MPPGAPHFSFSRVYSLCLTRARVSPRGCRERTEQSDARDRRYGVSVYVIATTYRSIRQASARSRSLSLAAPNLHQRIPKTCAIVRSERLYGLCGADIIGSPVKPRASYSVRCVRALQPVRRGGKNKNPAVCDTAVVSRRRQVRRPCKSRDHVLRICRVSLLRAPS